jgi:hypothetical protein
MNTHVANNIPPPPDYPPPEHMVAVMSHEEAMMLSHRSRRFRNWNRRWNRTFEEYLKMKEEIQKEKEIARKRTIQGDAYIKAVITKEIKSIIVFVNVMMTWNRKEAIELMFGVVQFLVPISFAGGMRTKQHSVYGYIYRNARMILGIGSADNDEEQMPEIFLD